MQIAVIGANGQVGSEIVVAAHSANCDVLALTHADCDVTDRASLDRAFRRLSDGDAVVNTAAFHRTDACEADPERAMAVNALGAYNVAVAAHARSAAVVFVSTDYVFDGGSRQPYVESDAPRPINAYGVSKLAGEMLLAHANAASYVTRISSVFGIAGSSGKGGNFVETMVAKADAASPPDVVDDIVMSPTYAADAAALLVQLLVRHAPFGTYHLSNAGACSWCEFADAIFTAIGSPMRARPIKSQQASGAAQRPRYSALASERLAPLGLASRPWRDALDAYLAERARKKSPASGVI